MHFASGGAESQSQDACDEELRSGAHKLYYRPFEATNRKTLAKGRD